ncbi:hypothetical protein TEA_015512 [Camellia sinensis var. sinensis]|uniref:Protein kinase domain-containing protein n=1 Tax=Camellia sinensis var. sinensis TaxID=542762 RepID=A0A4S4DMF6_CAMSN|nr:hypothetical protein TEA_015512 [Camellia sinensis var. sinensis]
MPNGSLKKWLHSSSETDNREGKQQRLNLLQRINIAIDLACALDFLHHHCQTLIIHCDLKPRNVLLDHDLAAHFGDFGLARFHTKLSNPNHSSSIGIRGTVGYAAPDDDSKGTTDDMFVGDLNLHNFARMALPEHVIEIVDPILLSNDKEEE